jgi:hypothetical protein
MTSSTPQDWRAETVRYRPTGQRAESAPVRRLRAGDEEAENVADRDLGSVDVTEHKRDPSRPAVYIDHDMRLRALTLLVDERSEVTSD